MVKKSTKQRKEMAKRRWISPEKLDTEEKQLTTEEYWRWYRDAPHF